MKERWALCLDGWYAVSNRGRVRRMRPRHDTRQTKRFSPTPVRLSLAGAGYPSFMPSVEGKQKKRWCVHILVAQFFIGKRPPGYDINHKDGNKQNNRWTNLEYVTRRENMQHAVRFGAVVGARKLTNQQVREIQQAIGASRIALARAYAVHPCTIYRVRSGRTYGFLHSR